jgi:hypothetical protein
MPARCVPNTSEPIVFFCPSCGAKYKVVMIEAPSAAPRNKFGCLMCDALFPAGEGRVSIKYILVKTGPDDSVS